MISSVVTSQIKPLWTLNTQIVQLDIVFKFVVKVDLNIEGNVLRELHNVGEFPASLKESSDGISTLIGQSISCCVFNLTTIVALVTILSY